jgi:hypothetical protein
MNDPINRIEWRDAATLNGNDYNPNVVFTPELRLLERSHPADRLGAADPDHAGRHHHRRLPSLMLARESEALRKRYAGKVPCAVLDVTARQGDDPDDPDEPGEGHARRGEDVEIVRELIDVHHCDPQEVAIEIGATKDEIDLLYQDGVFKMKNIESYRYSKAWYPEEKAKAPA